MTKLATPQTFDHSIIANTDSYKQLQPFIEYTTQLLSNIINMANNGTSVLDNIDCSYYTVPVTATVKISLLVQVMPIAVIVGRQDPITNPVTYFAWEPNVSGKEINIICDKTCTLTLIAFH